MPTSQQDPLRLPLISILILLIGFCISGCGDSEDDEGRIDEAAEPLVVTIINKRSDGPAVPARSDAEILADKILRHEIEAFFFDLPQRNQLIVEIERGLSLIRAAYPPMSEIRAGEEVIPGMLAIDLEPDLYEIVKEMLQDKQGQIRFETGNAEFDALNAKLGLQNVRLGAGLTFYFHRHLNLRVASEAYSMVKGVGHVSDYSGYDLVVSADINAFKQGATWYFIFLNAWGDCPAGCIYHELFCFTVTGTDVEIIPTAQAQTMPPFQELEATQRDRGPHNATPFVNATPLVNATAHTWSWWDNHRSWEYGGRLPTDDNLGCARFGEIEAFPNLLSVSCGYSVEALLREAGRFDDYDFTGVVLLLVATQERTIIGDAEARSTVVASKTVLAAKTAAEIQHPENVYFENVLMAINPPPSPTGLERWWGGVHPTFVVCWDHTEIDLRAYQVLEPNFRHASRYEASNQPNCDKIRDTDYIQILDVPFRASFPFFEAYGDEVYDDIDEVLPRP
ncbi:hypothetical protein C6502_12960 [Candidatus Poribacteria bacterium]|nr:MAG: hypothetical protein C6502_12960 [Candidatus Poribacteria bacterium]